MQKSWERSRAPGLRRVAERVEKQAFALRSALTQPVVETRGTSAPADAREDIEPRIGFPVQALVP